MNPLVPEEPGVLVNVPPAVVAKESMPDARLLKLPKPPGPMYQPGATIGWPAAAAAAATCSKVWAHRSATPKTIA